MGYLLVIGIILIYGLTVYFRQKSSSKGIIDIVFHDIGALFNSVSKQYQENKKNLENKYTTFKNEAKNLSSEELKNEVNNIRSEKKDLNDLPIEEKMKLKAYYNEFESRK